MAAGLDELIEYLLEEIALGGQTGVTFLELALLVNQFYQPILEDQRENGDEERETASRTTSALLEIDQRFLSKVWTWLSRHHDVSVGFNHQFDDKSLEDIEKTYPGYTNPAQTNGAATTTFTALAATEEQDGVVEQSTLQPSPGQEQVGPRLFVSDERMSIALTGHLPDPARIVASEWILLSCIAATRKDGIMQGDLIRLSKQDKRSVPKRTDALHKKGYIVKQVLYVKGNKTSRLYLRRFADIEQSTGKSAASMTEKLTIAHVARQLFDVLKNNPLIPQEDLSEVLGMKSFGRARILTQLVRHFTKLGCLKRIKTAFAPSAKSIDLKVCIQLLKEPDDEDWQAQSTQDIDFSQPIEILASLYQADAEQSDAMSAEVEANLETDIQNDMLATDGDIADDTRILLPQWNPDRVLANVVVEILQAKGSEGVTNAGMKKQITGPFVRRILESLLVKMSNRALQSQPPNIRHLSIIRTTDLHDGVLRYLHFTFDVFIEKVKNGHAKWEDAAGGSLFVKESERLGKDVLGLLENIESDKFGFAPRTKLPVHPHDGEVTMKQLLEDAKVKNITPRPGEPELKRFDDGRLELLPCGATKQRLKNQVSPHTDNSRGQPSSKQLEVPVEQFARLAARSDLTLEDQRPREPKKTYRKPKRVDIDGQPIKGRPRKFARGTEKYWRDVCSFIIQDRNPDSRKKLTKAGITTDPEAQKILSGRPAGFDAVVLQAIEHKLPVAAAAREVNEKWMASMKAIMSRSQPGLYITPPGYEYESGRRKAQTFILRSKRLVEIDWSDRHQWWPWQQLSSSASHSFRYQRYYPYLDVTPEPAVHPVQMGDTNSNITLADKLSLARSARNTSHGDVQSSATPQILNTAARRVMVNLPASVPHQDAQVSFEASRAPTTSARRIMIQLPARQLEPGESRDMTAKEPNASDVFTKEIEMQAEDATATPLQHEQRLFKSSQVQKKVKAKTILPKPQASATRSSRKRRLTQKAAENFELLHNEFDHPLVTVDEAQDTDKAQHGNRSSQIRDNMLPDSPSLEANVPEMLQSTIINHQEQNSEIVHAHEPVHENETIDTLDTGLESRISSIHTEKPELDTPEKHGIAEAHTTKSNNIADEHPINKFAHIVPPSVGHTAIPPPGESASNILQPIEPLHLVNVDQPTSDILEPDMRPSTDVANEQTVDETMTYPMLNPWKRRRDVSQDTEVRPEIEQQVPLVPFPTTPAPTTPAPTTPAAKRAKTDGYEAKRAEVSKLVRILVLELVGLCSGLLPNVTWTLRRAMVPRWQEAGVTTEQLTVKTIRAAIKAHCESGKLKQITFAFRSKAGVMTKMSVLGLRGIDATSSVVLELQKRMAEMEPADYFPPELEAESLRTPNEMNKKRYQQELHELKVQEEALKSSQTSKAARKKRTTIRDASTEVDPEHTTEQQTQPSIPVTRAEQPLSPEPDPESEPQPVISLNTGFLTLKISRLKELNLPTGTLRRYVMPTPPLTVGADANGVRPDQQVTKPKRKYRRRTQARGTAHFDPDTHTLIWKQTLALPSSLDQILKTNYSREQALPVFNAAPGSAAFEAEVDCVAAWELRFSDVLPDTRSEKLIFINHVMSYEDLNIGAGPERIEFKALVVFDDSLNSLVEVSFPDTESWPSFVAALQSVDDAPTFLRRATGSRKRRATKRKAGMALDLEDGGYGTPAPKRRKPSQTPRRPRRTLHTAASYNDADVSAWAPLKRNRIGQVLRHMTEEEKYEVVVAVVLVRTILGGIEKFIDWRIVLRLVPNQAESVVRDSWRTMANRYRSDVSELTDGLQYRYLEALNNNSVPSVNFDDTHATDWEGIYQWALTNLDKTLVKKVEELPESRHKLLRRNDYVFNEPRRVRDLLGYNVIHTVPRREEVLAGTVFGKPLCVKSPRVTTLKTKPPAEDEESDIDLCRAKSWVMATLLTPEGLFDIKTIHEKLLTLADTPQKVEDLLERAIKSLQREKLVSRAGHMGLGSRNRDDSPFVRLRRYEISAKFFEQFEFRRLITTPMLKRAAKYKFEVLDAAFETGDTVVIAKDTILNDGEMVAILNLVAMGMLNIKPGSDVPNSLWGLGWQSHQYTTRMIDKKTLGFSVILSPIEYTYIYGDPIATTRAHSNATIPRGEIDMISGQGRIPIWFDITHRFQPGLWEMVLGVVLGLVSIRPGVEVKELVRMMWYSVAADEVNLILEWAARLDLVKRTDSGFGWETCAWWWLGVGSGVGWRVDEQTISNLDVDNGTGIIPLNPPEHSQELQNNNPVDLTDGNGSDRINSPARIYTQSQPEPQTEVQPSA